MENKIKVKQLSEHIYAMDDQGATGYVVLGKEKALVIDTMNASDDLKAVVRTITKLPLMVVNTHGHGDHICGNIFFEEAYIHPADLPLALEFASYPDFVEEINKHGLSMPPFKELPEGTVIDLGGATLDVILLPGHTQGGICLLYREERVLFTGDGINCHLWMQLDHSLQLKELKKSLENISWVKEKADKILHGHTMDYNDISLFDELYKGVKDLVEHPELAESDADYNWFGGVAKQHVFGEGKVICYTPEKLK